MTGSDTVLLGVGLGSTEECVDCELLVVLTLNKAIPGLSRVLDVAEDDIPAPVPGVFTGQRGSLRPKSRRGLTLGSLPVAGPRH